MRSNDIISLDDNSMKLNIYEVVIFYNQILENQLIISNWMQVTMIISFNDHKTTKLSL